MLLPLAWEQEMPSYQENKLEGESTYRSTINSFMSWKSFHFCLAAFSKSWGPCPPPLAHPHPLPFVFF